MPKTKISEFSATPGNNTDIDGINIAEGCPPSGINDAIRELMAQLKDFQAGTAGDSFNGPIGTTTPAAGVFTNLSASGTFALTGDQVQISEGGTGQTTANAAFNALAPSQTSQAGKYLKTDGTNASWDALDISTADITGTLPIANGGTGLTALGTGVQTALGQNVTGSGGIVLATSPVLTTPNLGTPSAATLTNATGLPISTGVSGLGTGVATALAVNTGSAGAFVVNGGALGTPSGGTLTNCTGYPTSALSGSINLATQVTGTLATTNGGTGLTSFTANGVVYASSTSALTTGSALSFDGTSLLQATGASAAVFRVGSTVSSGRAATINLGNSTSAVRATIALDAGTELMTVGPEGAFPLVFQYNGSEAMRLDSTGLGIGTSSPNTRLHIVGLNQTNGTAEFTPNAAKGSNASYVHYGTNGDWYIRSASASGNVNIQDTGGNVGIGTSSPTARLTVVTSVNNEGVIRVSDNATYYGELSRVNATDEVRLGSYGTSQNLTFYTVSSERARITSAGDFELKGGRSIKLYNAANSSTSELSSDATGLTQFSHTGVVRWLNSTATGTLMTLDASGNLLVGTTSATTVNSASPKLVVFSNAGDNIIAKNSTQELAVGCDYVSANTNNALRFATNNTERSRITSGGAFLINKTTTGTAGEGLVFNPNGNSLATLTDTGAGDTLNVWNDTASAYRFYVTRGGTIFATNTTISAISDQRFKENIVDLDVGLDAVMALKPRKFDWKTGKGKDIKGDRGFIAQEFEQVFPDLIDEWKDPAPESEEPYKSVRQDLIPVLVKAIQELKAQNDDLRARVAQLEAK